MERKNDSAARIADTLRAIGVSASDVDARTWAQLEQVEACVTSEVNLYRAAKEELRRHRLSIDSVHKLSGISRQTFYNKDGLLARYVERRRADEKVALESEASTALRKKLDEALTKIRKLEERDGELVILAAENERLRKRIEALDAYIKSMPDEIQQELESYGHIIPFQTIKGQGK